MRTQGLLTLLLPAIASLSIVLVDPAAAQDPPVTRITDDPAMDTRPTWSPDGTRIAFASTRSGVSNIWTVPAGGGMATQLTTSTNGASNAPDWSPDGAWIAYESYPDVPPGGWHIRRVRVADGSSYRLSQGSFDAWHPAWSPDGTQIAYRSTRNSADTIILMPATGGGGTPLVPGSDPAWSPDGARIVYHVQSPLNGYDLWVGPVAGGPGIPLTDFVTDEADAEWSPDGTKIVYTETNAYGGHIAVIPAAGGPPRLLTTLPANDWDPAWSPDGTKIAFASDRSGNWDIWVMDVSVLAVEPAAQAPAIVQLAASPNPFREGTTIRIPGAAGGGGSTTLRIADVAGRIVRELGIPATTAGGESRTLLWDGRDWRGNPVSRGTYYLTLEGGSRRLTGRAVRVR